MPQRIQRKRTKGWKMPPDTVYVGRPTRWGNPYIPGINGSAKGCVTIYREDWERHIKEEPKALVRLQAALAGKNLACWCKLDQPCHADYLLELANPKSPDAECEDLKMGNSFVFDITEGKSRKQLADDYLRCSREAGHWQDIALALVEAAPDAVAKLPDEYRVEIERMIEAYKD